ncbi:uncharacterized protein LOC131855699 [Achroia grisella]|uniref:uncharacterized protein LOC131855699 n=1 Tax=Achroia grisella TaxID=688607 RepID=UPI0027D210CC|nr:uncharacterized protein LOC131855699 [Achroia grisella]
MERSTLKKIEDLNVDRVVRILESVDLAEFAEFVIERDINGKKLLDVTEGIIKLWRPSVNAKRIVLFIEEFKLNPDKFIKSLDTDLDVITETESKSISVECQYQTVPARRLREDMASTTLTNVEELLKRLVPAKSFLYRNQPRKIEKSVPSYMPMDGAPKKPRRFFRLSSYEYPQLDILSRTSKNESFDDRGYYSVKTNNRYFIQKTYKRQDSKTKYKSLSTAEELNEKLPEDHFYEDLCYSDMHNTENKIESTSFNQVATVKPCIVKIQELFQSFKLPFFRKNETISDKSDVNDKPEAEIETNVYENGDNVANMYDSVHVIRPVIQGSNTERNQSTLPVEDYLEPIQLNKDYCDVTVRERDDSLLGYIMSIFDNRFGFRRETNDAVQDEDSQDKVDCTSTEIGRMRERPRTNMADRPLPVPVENEPYYMNVDRAEAENLLMGQPDGMFILRPSSQPSHAYTLSVSCSGAVHNVGVRRRPDGRLALGFPRRGERSFATVTSLLRHHRRRRLLLVAAGGVIGATTLNETPHYYQTPSNLPVL